MNPQDLGDLGIEQGLTILVDEFYFPLRSRIAALEHLGHSGYSIPAGPSRNNSQSSLPDIGPSCVLSDIKRNASTPIKLDPKREGGWLHSNLSARKA